MKQGRKPTPGPFMRQREGRYIWQSTDSDLAHLSPALYAHLNRYGKYHFEAMSSLDQLPHRPLRQPSVLKA